MGCEKFKWPGSYEDGESGFPGNTANLSHSYNMNHHPSLKLTLVCIAVLYRISQCANGQDAIGQAMSPGAITHTARQIADTAEPVPVVNADSDYSAAIEKLSVAIRHEVESKQLPAFSIALIENDKTVWSAGFGHQDADKKIPATPDTVYRVGSVSKLFTDSD